MQSKLLGIINVDFDIRDQLLVSALQLFVSFGLLNYFFPFLPLLRPLFPIAHPHLPQVIPHFVLLSYSWPSLRSCCIRFPFVYGLGHSFIGHSFYMPQPAQSFVFYISYYIFILIASSNSSSVLSRHSPFAFCVGPNILLNILPFDYQ
jgi:hypothetical protein